MLNPANVIVEGKIADFDGLFKQGRRWKGRFFQAVFRFPQLPDSKGAHCRWAVIASKKGVDKRATRRNRAKRRLRALVREVLVPAFASQGFETRIQFALVASRRAPTDAWGEMREEAAAFAQYLVKEAGIQR
jgi:ribonuclease P protein component